MRRSLTTALVMIALSWCSAEPVTPVADMELADVADVAIGPLIDHDAWQVVAAEDDPFDDRPDVVMCERGAGWEVEPLDATRVLGVETSSCNYLGLVQPSLKPLAAGDKLQVQVFHFQLEGDGPAHVAVALDGKAVWETTVDIPAASELIAEQFTLDSDVPQGSEIVFHLHNHGLNSWNLISLDVVE